MYEGGTFPGYFISTAFMRKPDQTGRCTPIRKTRVAPKYGDVDSRLRPPHSTWYVQHRNQRAYDKLVLRTMVEMEEKRAEILHMDVRHLPIHTTPVMDDKPGPITFPATNAAFQYKRALDQTHVPIRYTDSPQHTQRLLQHDLVARSSLSSYASRSNLPSPMRSLYSRHVASRPPPSSQSAPSMTSPRQLTCINIRL